MSQIADAMRAAASKANERATHNLRQEMGQRPLYPQVRVNVRGQPMTTAELAYQCSVALHQADLPNVAAEFKRQAESLDHEGVCNLVQRYVTII